MLVYLILVLRIFKFYFDVYAVKLYLCLLRVHNLFSFECVLAAKIAE
jgi:hypothetical protein